MPRTSVKTAKIRAAIEAGAPVAKIAARFDVSTAYVYKLRKDIGVRPAPAPKAKPPRRQSVVKVVPKQPVEVLPTIPRAMPEESRDIAMTRLLNQPPVSPWRPTEFIEPPPPPKTTWQRLKDFLRGAR